MRPPVLNTCQEQAAQMTVREIDCARGLFEQAYPDGDLQLAINNNSAVAAYYLRCGVLGKEPPDGE